VLNTAFISRI